MLAELNALLAQAAPKLNEPRAALMRINDQ